MALFTNFLGLFSKWNKVFMHNLRYAPPMQFHQSQQGFGRNLTRFFPFVVVVPYFLEALL